MRYHRQEPLRHVGDVPAMGADRYGEKLALTYRGDEQSYADLLARSNRVAGALVAHGVEPGDRVAMLIENSLQFPETLFGAMRAGAVPVPLNHRMDGDTLAYVLRDADATALVVSPAFPSVGETLHGTGVPDVTLSPGGEGMVDYDAAVADADPSFDRVARDFGDVALQPYTSGTTGDPKGVLLTHENLLTTVNSYTRRGGTDPEADVALLVLPLFHLYGLSTVLTNTLYGGGTVVLRTLPVPGELLGAITDHEVRQFAAIPAIFVEMVEEYEENPDAYDLSSIELVGSGAAPLADDTRRRIEEAFDSRLVEGWGMTETTTAGTTASAYGVEKPAGCVGQPLPDLELRVVEPAGGDVVVDEAALDPTSVTPVPEAAVDVTGELAVRGPQVFAGYHDLPDRTAAAFDDEGFFHTGDLVRVDADGFVWMVDRKDDMLVVGGENVYPAEVEDALFDHPDVSGAAVVGAPHEVKGEAPVAFVVPTPGADLDAREVREFAFERVASYAHPRGVFVVDELPRSGTRKVKRHVLAERARERLDGPLAPSEEL